MEHHGNGIQYKTPLNEKVVKNVSKLNKDQTKLYDNIIESVTSEHGH